MAYLNLAVLLAFIVGQVQYGCISHFCTMMQSPVSAPELSMNSEAYSCEGPCSCSRRITLRQYGLQLVENNCVKAVYSKKSVISSFTDSTKLLSHFVMVLGFMPTLYGHKSAIGDQLSAINNAASPPLDLPILNSNLRI
ncbi:MAG: hypothetical protein M1469_11030 [Bacteroidetes bacterium]|jgi:hypothetical protein|nr:hypothetical protein [Bacteroidota bacterium]